LNTLLFSDGLNVLYGDLVALEGTILDPLLVGPGLVIDEDATSDKTSALMPVVEGRDFLVKIIFAEVLRKFFDICLSLSRSAQKVDFTLPGFGYAHSVIPRLRLLMMEMHQRIPLARTLSVEFDFVIVTMQS
jgi:hypothetical protein